MTEDKATKQLLTCMYCKTLIGPGGSLRTQNGWNYHAACLAKVREVGKAVSTSHTEPAEKLLTVASAETTTHNAMRDLVIAINGYAEDLGLKIADVHMKTPFWMVDGAQPNSVVIQAEAEIVGVDEDWEAERIEA